jgi:hypothetical protein
VAGGSSELGPQALAFWGLGVRPAPQPAVTTVVDCTGDACPDALLAHGLTGSHGWPVFKLLD